MNDITQVSFSASSGAILPELQWHEQIIITPDKVSLIRDGRVADTTVNAGTWVWEVDAAKVAALFRQLREVDCTTIKRIEPDVAPDGGGAQSYTIRDARNRACSLSYDPGVTYANGELVVAPVREFVQSLTLPADAATRYRFP